jgi:hypothetical protein
MTDQSPRGNSFRAAIVRGERAPLIISEKQPRLEPGNADEPLEGRIIPRAETRRGDHRLQDRHRLTAERGFLHYKKRIHEVEVVNLSGGGAMIRSDVQPRLWEIVQLSLGDGPRLEAAVRWLKAGLIGLEFAHETQLDCPPEQRAALLLEAIRRTFPDMAGMSDAESEAEAQEQARREDLGARSELRHPLIWKGEIHYDFESNPVRLRNVSAGGVLLDVEAAYPVGAEVLLDLGRAGQYTATCSWTCGDQAGFRFRDPFDIACLAKARPEVAPQRWVRPSFLDWKQEDDCSPWNKRWNRGSIEELRGDLEGFLKR